MRASFVMAASSTPRGTLEETLCARARECRVLDPLKLCAYARPACIHVRAHAHHVCLSRRARLRLVSAQATGCFGARCGRGPARCEGGRGGGRYAFGHVPTQWVSRGSTDVAGCTGGRAGGAQAAAGGRELIQGATSEVRPRGGQREHGAHLGPARHHRSGRLAGGPGRGCRSRSAAADG